MPIVFVRAFEALTSHAPFRWQQRLFDRFVADDLPAAIDLPTGLGKTSVMAIWLLARLVNPRLPRRLAYIVDRRTVVDQATTEAKKLRDALQKPELADLRDLLIAEGAELPLSTLRGQLADTRKWLQDPSLPAIIVGTIDMIGSRLLFEGYGVSRRMRPYQAGLLGADTLVVLDEAHLSPPFEALLRAIAGDDALKPRGEERRAVVPGFRLLPLSATGRTTEAAVFRLEAEDVDPAAQSVVHQRYVAGKRLTLYPAEKASLAAKLAERAGELGGGGKRVLVYCHSREVAQKVADDLADNAKDRSELIVGARRVHEREKLAERLGKLGFAGDAPAPQPEPAFVVATSAGEVGIDIDADHMVCDLVAYERMVQRLGRVNRRGGDGRIALIDVYCVPPEQPKASAKDDAKKREAEAHAALLAATKALLESLPQGDDGRHDASPCALAALKTQAGDERIAAATTRAPLHPALDRAVVDAWSLTALREHPGRPEPEPWLRGWVDDEPQVQVIWRRFLPWRRGERAPDKADVEAFFAAARPHASEILEAPVDLVIETLIARAGALVQSRKAAANAGDDGGTQSSPAENAPEIEEGLIVLTPARELKSSRDVPPGVPPDAAAWTLETLASFPLPKSKSERDAWRRLLANATIVVSASLGGLHENGLLSKAAIGAPSCADSEDAEAKGWKPGFRVQVTGSGGDDSRQGGWKLALRLPLSDGDEDEPRLLTVLVWRGADESDTGDRAISRRAQSLPEHGDWAAEAAGRIADALGLSAAYRAMLVAAARAHDLGKARELWQNAMRAPRAGRPYAKTTAAGDPARLRIGPHTYRHEFGSLRDIEAEPALLADVPEELRELALHLVAAHHGFARPLIAPVDPAAATLEESGARAAAVALRFARLQRDWGPWGLAWWEALLRAADWRASARNDAAGERKEAAVPPAARTEPA